MSEILDIFSTDPFFKVANLSEALIKRPMVPYALGAMNLFQEMPLTVDRVAIEELDMRVGLAGMTPKNGPGMPITMDKRKGRIFEVPTFELNAEVWASDVAGVRDFGSPTALQTVQNLVFRETDKIMQGFLEPTYEYLRMQSIKGYMGQITSAGVVDSNIDLCSSDYFGVTRATDLDVDFTTSTAATLIGYMDTIRDRVLAGLGGIPYTGLVGILSPTLYRALKANSVVQDQLKYAYMGQGEAAKTLKNLGPNNTADVLAGVPSFEYQGITWVEYTVSLGFGLAGAVPFITAGDGVVFPTGVPGMFVRYNAPATFVETINTPGLPVTAKTELKRMGRGVDIAVQSRPLFLNTRPGAVVRLY